MVPSLVQGPSVIASHPRPCQPLVANFHHFDYKSPKGVPMAFSMWLSEQCARVEMTQADLMRAVNADPGPAEVSRQAVSRWFTGAAVPSASSLLCICDALSISTGGRAAALRLVAEHSKQGAA